MYICDTHIEILNLHYGWSAIIIFFFILSSSNSMIIDEIFSAQRSLSFLVQISLLFNLTRS